MRRCGRSAPIAEEPRSVAPASSITEDPCHIHDLQATILHLLGMDHKKLTFRAQGRDFRLTDVHGELFKPLLA